MKNKNSLSGLDYYFVDDAPDFEFVQEQLTNDGANCKNFFELDKVSWNKPRLTTPKIVLDLMFPSNWRDGVEFLREVRTGRTELPCSTPVVVFTAAGQDAMEQCFELGANDFYSKGYELGSLEKGLVKLGLRTRYGLESKKKFLTMSTGEKFKLALIPLQISIDKQRIGYLDLDKKMNFFEGMSADDEESRSLVMGIFSYVSRLADWDFARFRPIMCSKQIFANTSRPPPWEDSSLQIYLGEEGKSGFVEAVKWMNRVPLTNLEAEQ